MRIDLNSDLGEHYGAWRLGDDETMLTIVTSANVACGFHAGDPRTMRRPVTAAARNGVAVGAHVSYPDLVGFGRRPMTPADDELETDVIYQLGALRAMAESAGTSVRYVKPHGALYNTIAHDERQAAAVLRAIRAVDPDLPLVCLAGSPLVEWARQAGLRPVPEAFADRAYEPSGALVPRDRDGAVLHDPREVAARMVRLVTEGVLRAADGSDIAVNAESICVHGDSTGAVELASAVRDQLREHGVELRAFTEER